MKIGDSNVRLRRAGDVPPLRVSVKARQAWKRLGGRKGGYWADYGETSFRGGRGTYAEKLAVVAARAANEPLAAPLPPALPSPVVAQATPLAYASFSRGSKLVLVDELGKGRKV